ncbi:NACHT domain-containing protein [Coleofasciculus sp. FACHB-129]|uniref:NACHT C-terminal helical domain 2-containing protein n=1 Tax=Cyanophyceae TaxID=3028117 RepID=UPI001688CD34|nr:NACHT domain-containing protein [Coleofasciculus sp. FACHB-129]MBD1895529.1 NACHT domain-containing NTPase [Coleofasciculus sp. FACHB-129]
MMSFDELNTIIERIASGTQTATDVEALRVALSNRSQDLLQLGKYNVNIGQGQDIHIGNRTYVTWNEEAIQALIEVVQKLQSTTQTPTPQLASVDELVQQVRSHLHDDIQCLHGTMPLWGVDRWVPLGELFVDVNILEEVSSSRKSELDDLWQDFTTGMQGYSSNRSLERIGLGKQRQRVSGLEVLAKNTNLMVVGKPGSGKTTYLQRVVTECHAGNLQAHRIPVLIKLREFVEDGREVAYSLERYLERCWRLSDAETQLVLDRGRALVLLDGLDEVTGEDGKKIAYEIKRFARAYPQVQVIVTCRTQSQESRFERFDYVEVADFNEPQVLAFTEHWFMTVMGDKSAGLAKAQEFLGLLFLEENKPIRELAITPILLSLTCAVFRQTGKFYSKRSKLYEEGLELLLEQWDKSREIERDEIYRDLSVERKLELLSYLAVKKFEQEQYVLFEQAEIEEYIAEFLQIGRRDSRAVLRAIEVQHGLLIERSQKVWSFSHLTFQEYFTAKWFVDYADWQSLVSHIKEEHWREVFLLAVEMVNNTNQLLRLMKENVDAITAKDQKLQQFLDWLNQKHLSIKTFYKLAAVRAFYFVANSTLYVPYGNGLDFDLAFALDFQHGSARAVALSIPPPDELTLSAIKVAKGIYALDLDYDLALDRSLSNALSIASDFIIYNVKNATDPACPDSKLARELSIDLSRPGSLDPELDQILRNLKYQLPEPNKDERAKTWWQTNSQAWTEQLRFTIIKYRNIGQDWQFSDCKKQLLKQYYDANKLLVDCLNSGCVVSDEAREEIEDTLLLPIAEIEKRKREKLE